MTSHETFPLDLMRGLQQGRAVLFIGPGISKASGLSTREAFYDAIQGALRQQVSLSEADELEEFLARATSREHAQALSDQVGREAYLEFLKEQYDPRDVPPPPLLYALRALPFRVLLSTNPDRLLERTFENPLEDKIQLDVVIPKPGQEEPIPEPSSRPLLVKLFGDYQEPESLVMNTDDYESYFRLRPQLVTRLKALLEVGPALFVGYHVNDPEFRRVYAQVGALLARAHKRAYALMDHLSRFESKWWSQRALTILSTGEKGLEGALRELYLQLQRQTHPALGLGSNGDLHEDSGAPADFALLSKLTKVQLKSAQENWMLSDMPGSSEAAFCYVPIPLVAESAQGTEREEELGNLMSQDNPEVLRQLAAPQYLDANAALELTPKMLVLGPAGAGKTTLLLHLLKTQCEKVLEEEKAFLVVYLPIRFVAAAPESSVMECMVDYLTDLLPEDTNGALENAVMDALIDGRAMVLLDGLEDVGAAVEEDVLSRLGAFLKDCPDIRLLLTCRSGAYEPDRMPRALNLAVHELASLTPELRNALIRTKLRGKSLQAESLIALLRTNVAPWADRLASNPLHLSLLCTKFSSDGSLSDGRPSLYSVYLGSLLRRSSPNEENSLYAFDKELILQAIAIYSMTHPQEPLTKELLLDLVGREMSRAIIAPRKDVNKRVDAVVALSEITRNSGILVGPDPHKTYDFRHAAIKEYLATRRLMTFWDEESETIQKHLDSKRWAGVWRLISAMMDDATEFLERLEASPNENTKLVARCFGEAHRIQPSWMAKRLGERQGATEEFGSWLARLHDKLSPQETLDLFGEILWRDQETFLRDGRRTDARSVYIALTGLTRMMEDEGAMAHQAAETIASWRGAGEPSPDNPWPCTMVKIDGGPFLMRDPRTGVDKYVNVGSFEIGQTPVTFSQFQVFNPAHDLSEIPRIKRFLGPTQPVVHISWFEAWVCARWYACILPTQAQWEKAAGWDPETQSKRIYPWGNEWAPDNCNGLHTYKGKGHTTAVDRFGSSSESAYGCREMVGNVLEWTMDRGEEGFPERRILRGGSWQASPLLLTTTASVWLKPSYVGMEVGMRLCRPLED